MTIKDLQIISIVDSHDQVSYDYVSLLFLLHEFPAFFNKNAKYYKKFPTQFIQDFPSLSDNNMTHFTFAHYTPKKGWHEVEQNHKKAILLITIDWVKSQIPDFIHLLPQQQQQQQQQEQEDIVSPLNSQIYFLQEKVYIQEIQLNQQKIDDLEIQLALQKQLLLKNKQILDSFKQQQQVIKKQTQNENQQQKQEQEEQEEHEEQEEQEEQEEHEEHEEQENSDNEYEEHENSDNEASEQEEEYLDE